MRVNFDHKSQGRRIRALAVLLLIGASALSGCSTLRKIPFIGGKEKSLPVIETEVTTAENVKKLRKMKPGLPGDHAHARYTDEVLRGDHN